MKKVLKSRLFVAIITAIICITGTAYAATQILAGDIKYKNSTVESALDDLYTTASDYVKLDNETTVSTANLLNGITAYDNLGNLITGTVTTDCVRGSFTCTNCTSTDGQEITTFNPSAFVLYTMEGYDRRIWHYDSSITENQIQYYIGNTTEGKSSFGITASSNYIKDNKLKLNNFASKWQGQLFNYYACK